MMPEVGLTNKRRQEMMDRLGQLMFDWEQAQDELMAKHKAELDEIGKLKEILKKEILIEKQTVVSEKLEVQYHRGSVKWDTKWLDGFAIAHPEYELAKYRETTSPTVAFKLREYDDGR